MMNNLIIKITKFFIWAFLALLLFSNQSFSQNIDEVQQQLLEKKIKESKLSDSEIQKKADATGFTAEDLMNLQKVAQKKDSLNNATGSSKRLVITPPSSAPKNNFSVPDFKNRAGAENLQGFGYSIFNYIPSTFEPSLNIPTPTNYIIGPGDEIIISLWGETQQVHNLTVSKNGDIYIPNVGLIDINGLSLREVKSKIFTTLSKVYSTLKSDNSPVKTKIEVTTGKLRSVKVYLLGEVNVPGGYTLPSLSSAFTAIYYGGGPTINGTLRNIQVIRGGKIISKIDLYDFLISGKKTNDVRLEDEDIIFVPQVGKRIAATGNLFRPSIYELREKENFSDLLKFAGGLKSTAYYERTHIERIIPFAQRKVYSNNILSIDLNYKSIEELIASTYKLEDGDVISFPEINSFAENRVVITGYVKKPGVYEIPKSGLKIRDLILKADSLRDNAFTQKATIVRTLPTEKKEILTFNLIEAIKNNPNENISIQNRDSVIIYNYESFSPTRTVEILGEVKAPGTYNRVEKLTLSKLLVLAGGVTEKATLKNIEITRLDTTKMDVYSKRLVFALPQNYWNTSIQNDFELQDYDRIVIKSDPYKNFSPTVKLTGEFIYPGAYSIIKKGERLLNFIKRAGGFKQTAYFEGLHIIRDENLLSSSILPIKDSILFRNKSVTLFNPTLIQEISKRIPIDWLAIQKDSNSVFNVELMPGDEVVLPMDSRIVKVVGDVGIPSLVPFKKGEGIKYYIKQAGGYKQTSADGDEIVILPNGKKWERSGFFLVPDDPILSGSTVIVPTRVEYSNSSFWTFLKDAITVLSSAAIVIFTITKL